MVRNYVKKTRFATSSGVTYDCKTDEFRQNNRWTEYTPTPDEIRQEAARIRCGWSRQERISRKMPTLEEVASQRARNNNNGLGQQTLNAASLASCGYTEENFCNS